MSASDDLLEAELGPTACLRCYISVMTRERKSPQQKKQLEYTKNHFTFGRHSSRMFPTTWKRKKTRSNREYRRKSEEILAQAKPGIAIEDAELLADDLTAARFQKSVILKPLHKIGTVTLGEKVKRKLDRREEAVGRGVQRRRKYNQAAASAISTLCSLDGEKLVAVVRRADLLYRKRNAEELKRVMQSNAPIDRAIHFLYLVGWGSGCGSAFEIDAVRRNPELDNALGIWLKKAKRILTRDKRPIKRKLQEKQITRKKLSALRAAERRGE